jgi:hypothetical protein
MDARADRMSYRNGSDISASNVLLRRSQVKSRVALVCLVWGEEFADFFARYCVRSLLEPRNIPLLAREQEVTLLLYTDRATQDFLDRSDSFNALSRLVKLEWLLLEQLPAAARSNHWVPWQHALAGRNRDFDLFLVIIPDCIYAAGCLGTIVDALAEHDTVYYRLPQVCRETVTVELDRLRRVEGHESIGFTTLEAVELFIRHVNPKHAVAACSGRFFINHPEYAIQLSPKSMIVSEIASHPLAVRASARSVSYTFDALSLGASTCYLEILGVSAEPTLKFVEQYYRWPKLHRDHSRALNLGSWAWNFRDASSAAYSKSAIHIALDRGRALEQRRGQVKRMKTEFFNTTLDYLAIATRLYERARQSHNATVARYIALAMAAPGFHRYLRRLQPGFTVVLPRREHGFEEVVERIVRRPAAQEMLRRLLFLHVVAGELPTRPGHSVLLTYPDAADRFPRAFIVDSHTPPGPGLLGREVSRLHWVWENAFYIEADIDYSHLTWSMLDPVNGTSERVLDRREATSPIGRLRRKARSALWRRLREAGLRDPILHLARTRAPRFYEIARKVYRSLRPHPKRPLSVSLELLPAGSARDSYDRVSKLNIIDDVASVTRAFYERLGLSPQQSPAYRCLASMHAKLTEEVEALATVSTGSSLEHFEIAWRAYEAGATGDALRQFSEVIADEQLAKAAAADPWSREACIRAAEILGRHAELGGDAAAAERLYRRVLEFAGNGIVARRLLVMLWRQGRIGEAADLAPRVVQSDTNLVQHLQGSAAVGDLTRRLEREARVQSTKARGQNARDLGLQVG